MIALGWTAVVVVTYLGIGFGLYVQTSVRKMGLRGYLLHLTIPEERRRIRLLIIGWLPGIILLLIFSDLIRKIYLGKE
jgi:hypothetical protein